MVQFILKLFLTFCLIYCTTTITIDEDELSTIDENYFEENSTLSIEAESLQNLNDFILNSANKILSRALPYLIESESEVNVSNKCTKSFFAFLQGLQSGKEWAFQMLDASGKPPSGILDATLTDFGSFDECINLNVNLEKTGINVEGEKYLIGRYCIMDVKAAFQKNLIYLDDPPPKITNDSVLWSDVLRLFWSRNSLLSFRFGLCVPSFCTHNEINDLANFLIENIGLEANVNNCQVQKKLEMDFVQIVIISCFCVILAVVIIGTLTETFFVVSVEKKITLSNKKSWLNFFVFFSIYSNTRKVLSKSKLNNNLEHLNGIRFLSTLWIILGHTYFYTDFVHYHHYRNLINIQKIDDNVAFMPFANFTLSVDTFFFISGLLVVYSSWKNLIESDGKIDFIKFISHKIWRIWPTYLVIIGLVLILPLMGSGPLWPQAVENMAHICHQNWWLNIFFLNNFQSPNNLCLFHTWFLSTHIQFHLFSTFILFLMYRYPKLTLSLLLILIILSGVGIFIHTIIYDLHWPTVIADEVFVDYEAKILTLYIRPYNHLGPYFFGIIFGYLLLTQKNRLISFNIQIFCWFVSMLVLTIVIFAPYLSFNGLALSSLQAGLYLSIHRIAWSIGIGWITFACSTNKGGFINKILSWSFFGPLGKLSFIAYLIHPILMIFHTGRIRERILFAHYELINIFLARAVISFILAYVLYISVELPFASLEKYFRAPKLQFKTKTCDLKPNNKPISLIISKSIPNLTLCKKNNEFI